jgi:hypothetical protein
MHPIAASVNVDLNWLRQVFVYLPSTFSRDAKRLRSTVRELTCPTMGFIMTSSARHLPWYWRRPSSKKTTAIPSIELLLDGRFRHRMAEPRQGSAERSAGGRLLRSAVLLLPTGLGLDHPLRSACRRAKVLGFRCCQRGACGQSLDAQFRMRLRTGRETQVGRHGNSSWERERGGRPSSNSQSAAARLAFGPALLAGGMRNDCCRFLFAGRCIGSPRTNRVGGAPAADQFDGDHARRRGSCDLSHLGVRLVVQVIQHPRQPQPGRVL